MLHSTPALSRILGSGKKNWFQCATAEFNPAYFSNLWGKYCRIGVAPKVDVDLDGWRVSGATS